MERSWISALRHCTLQSKAILIMRQCWGGTVRIGCLWLGFAEVSSHLVFIVKSAVELPKLRHNLAWKISTCGSLGFLVERVWCFLGADEEDYPWLLGTNVKGRAWAKVYQCPNELTRKVDDILVN